MRKVSIDITEVINGCRLDIFDTAKIGEKQISRINVERYDEVLLNLLTWIKTESTDVKVKLGVL